MIEKLKEFFSSRYPFSFRYLNFHRSILRIHFPSKTVKNIFNLFVSHLETNILYLGHKNQKNDAKTVQFFRNLLAEKVFKKRTNQIEFSLFSVKSCLDDKAVRSFPINKLTTQLDPSCPL